MTIFLIDGENFLKKMRAVFESEKRSLPRFDIYNFRGLFEKILQDIKVDKIIFYFARLSEHPDTIKKSRELIEAQRLLKRHLENLGYEVVLSGRVRGQIEKDHRGKDFLNFKEKGVDVRIAVDMVTLGCDKKAKTILLGSSDSDLQPAIAELKNRGVERIYVGFESMPNKGLTFTTNRTILIRNSEVLEFEGRMLVS